MQTPYGHLTYCTNIHAGEHWQEHFAALQKHIPEVKKHVSPEHSFGIGLRLSNTASIELLHHHSLETFQHWLEENHCYVFTMNGFPYGGFHHTNVKDNVHLPDWTSTDRLVYTVRLFQILSTILPRGMTGGISTSPLSYRHWHHKEIRDEVFKTATTHILEVVEALIELKQTTGKSLHLDIEPEPDGLIESGEEFIHWYEQWLLPMGIDYLKKTLGYGASQAEEAIREHVQLCYDICHFAVGYEDPQSIIQQLEHKDIRVGKIQISAALKVAMPSGSKAREPIASAFAAFNESTYLHQVVALQQDGVKRRYPDLPLALKEVFDLSVKEWRSHFHVPLFIPHYEVLQATQSDIQEVLTIQRQRPFTEHLEIETYTWEVLPESLKLPMDESIVRELQWVERILDPAYSEHFLT
jgi:hypothetical protein